jgi:hypothetical protein
MSSLEKDTKRSALERVGRIDRGYEVIAAVKHKLLLCSIGDLQRLPSCMIFLNILHWSLKGFSSASCPVSFQLPGVSHPAVEKFGKQAFHLIIFLFFIRNSK